MFNSLIHVSGRLTPVPARRFRSRHCVVSLHVYALIPATGPPLDTSCQGQQSLWGEMSSIYFSSHRSTNSREKARLTNGLPSYSAAVQEKLYRHGRSSSWLVPLSAPIPGMRSRRLRLWVPNPARIHQVSVARFGRKRGTLVLCFGVFFLVFAAFAVHRRFSSSSGQWPTFPTGDPPTLVFSRADLQRIWKWEIDSGHYPSSQKSASRFVWVRASV